MPDSLCPSCKTNGDLRREVRAMEEGWRSKIDLRVCQAGPAQAKQSRAIWVGHLFVSFKLKPKLNKAAPLGISPMTCGA